MLRSAAVVAALALGACFTPETVTCADGRLCPAGMLCADGLIGCFTPDQVAECTGVLDGDPCTDPAGLGTCTSGVCMVPTCGNGVLDPGEECDCGIPDDTADPPAGCDRFNDPDAGLCTPACTLHCGDGVVAEPEQCDGPEVPTGLDCADVGHDYGALKCSHLCGADDSGCGTIGLAPDLPGTTADLVDAWASGARVFAITDEHLVLTRDPSGAWDAGTELAGDLRAIHGVADDDVLVVGGGGFAAHWDGQTWRETPTPTVENLAAVWMASATDAWAVGTGSTLLHWDGTAWEARPFVNTSGDTTLVDVWATGHQLFVISYSTVWQGSADALVESPLAVGGEVVRGRREDDVYIGGTVGLAHWDGATWQTLDVRPMSIHALWLDDDELFAAGDGGLVLHHDDDGWGTFARSSNAQFAAIAGTRADDLLFVGTQGAAYAYQGWTWLQSEGLPPIELRDLWFVPGRGVVVSAEGGLVLEENEGFFTDLPKAVVDAGPAIVDVDPFAVYATGPDDVWLAGRQGEIARWDGVAWTSTTWSRDETWYGLWGEGAYVVAAGWTVSTWDGAEWIAEDVPLNGPFTAVTGAAPGELAIVEDRADVAWRHAGVWTAESPPIPASQSVTDVWMDGRGLTVVVGTSGTIAMHTDAGWSTAAPPTLANFTAVHGDGPSDVFAVGQAGAMIWYDGSHWTSVRTPTFDDLLDVWVTPTRVYACGTSGTLLRLVRSTP